MGFEKFEKFTLGRVVNGTDAADGAYPYMVSLRISANRRHFCGGSLISREWVLTAAHCIDYSSPEDILLVIGVTDFLDETENDFYNISQVVPHPQYDFWTIDFDFGLLKLAEPIELSDKIAIVELAEQDFDLVGGSWGVFSGWGVFNATVSNPSRLQRADLISVDTEECREIHAETGYDITDRMLCATYPGGGVDQCNGDSGGPYVYNGIQVGTSSWSVKPCGRYDFPGVMGRVASVRDWIASYVGI